jgi:outer membrane protein OmpA-like peptidoglycan-associated protein
MQFAGYNEVPMTPDRTRSPVVTLGLSYFTGGRAPQQAWTPPRVDTLRTVRVDTVRTVRADTVRLADLSADQVVLRVQFQTDRAELLPISGPVLNTVAAAIIATPGSRWQVEGHTDSVGSSQDNKTLSQQRAQSVVNYLVGRGVSRDAMTAVGYGPDRPVFSNTTAEGRAQNRRVQLRRIPAAPTQIVK